MKTITYKEYENGMRCITADTEGKQMDIIQEISKAEFEKRFPDVSTYGLEQLMPVFLENGTICINTEWNGERYSTDKGIIIPVYEKVEEDNFQIIGYYEV